MLTVKQSLRDQLSLSIRQRQGEDTSVTKQRLQLTSTLSPQEVRAKNNGRLNYARTPLVDLFQDEINDALRLLATGDFSQAARISQLAVSGDGWVSGVFGTFSASITSLPRKFVGDTEIARDLSHGYAGIEGDPRSLFDVIVRPSVLSSMLVDCRMLGVAVAELIRLPSLDYPIVARLDPQFLKLDRYSNTWLYQTDTGQALEVTAGDGRWMLLTPGGASEPWNGGIWAAVARDYARKNEALLNLDSWTRKHASPIRVGQTTPGASGADYDEYLSQMIEWSGTNTSVVLPPGWTLDLKETNGQGYQAYKSTVELANESLTIAIAGQLITTVGSVGFANGEVGLTVRGDLTKRYASDIATALSDQLLPHVVLSRYGSLDRTVALQLETDPPKDKSAIAKAVSESAAAIQAVVAAVSAAEQAGLNAYRPDIAELQRQFGIPEAEVQKVAPTAEVAPVEETEHAAPDVADTDPTIEQPAPPEQPASNLALSGVQVSSLVEIIKAVILGEIPRDSALQVIVLSYNVSLEQADKLLGSAGQGFVGPTPAATEATAAI